MCENKQNPYKQNLRWCSVHHQSTNNFHHFHERDNLTWLSVCSMDDITLSNWGELLKERICSYRSKFFPSRVNPIKQGGKNENAELLPLKVYPFTGCFFLKGYCTVFQHVLKSLEITGIVLS